ncbi:MAG TPA: fluoride efflux transporter CrcB [Candidatus Elarobacter sp.]|nr:fluoride efflux transporter CrcB [Candidatus Elarobacter sp.]
MLLWYIAAGSALGGVTRYLVGFAIQQRAGVAFPLGTLIINVTGSLLLGFLLRAALEGVSISPEMRAFLTTGFCGGYTTFSTFSYDSIALVQGGEYRRAAIYVTLSVVLSLIATFAGIALAQSVLGAIRGRS